jgi:hypothetical protein
MNDVQVRINGKSYAVSYKGEWVPSEEDVSFKEPMVEIVDVEDTNTGLEVSLYEFTSAEQQEFYRQCEDHFRSPRPKTKT